MKKTAVLLLIMFVMSLFSIASAQEIDHQWVKPTYQMLDNENPPPEPQEPQKPQPEPPKKQKHDPNPEPPRPKPPQKHKDDPNPEPPPPPKQ